jgi:hypothetical protein
LPKSCAGSVANVPLNAPTGVPHRTHDHNIVAHRKLSSQQVHFGASQRRLTIAVDFPRGIRFTHPKAPGHIAFSTRRPSSCVT